MTGSVTVTVRDNATINLTSAAGTNAQSLCINTAITSITYNIGGGGMGATITGLPAGVSGAYAGGVYTITGTPTATGTFNYSINTTGICNQTSAAGTITVNPDATINLASGNNNQTVCINTPIVSISYNVGGGGTGATAGGLPAGLTGTYSGGVYTITGTPTASGTFNYTVNTTGTCLQANATGTITVNPDATLNLTSGAGSNTPTLCINTAITNITYSIGGAATGATVSGLPAGVTGNYSGGVFTISGTPTATGTFPFTVNTTGSTCGTVPSNGTITVTPNATLNLTSGNNNQSACINTAIVSISYNVGGGGSGANATGLPAGVTGTYSGGVFTITGTPTTVGTFNFTVNTTGTCLQANASGTITVNPNSTLNLTSPAATTNQTLCVNIAVANITYGVGGAGTGASVTGLPAGVTGNFSGGVFTISGTPTAAGVYNYSVTTSGGTCAQGTLNGTITVNSRCDTQSHFG